MSTGGSGRTQTVTNTSGPPDYVRPQFEYAAKEAERLYKDKPTTYYPNQTYADFSPETQQSLQMTAQRATGGNALTPAAETLGAATLRGDYLNSSPGLAAYSRTANADMGTLNPALPRLDAVSSGSMLGQNPFADQQFDRIAGAIRRNVDTAAARGGVGVVGSGAYNNALVTGIGDAANNFYGNQYQQERQLMDAATQGLGQQSLATVNTQLGAASGMEGAYGRERALQNAALGLSPELAAAGYADANALAGVGAARENQAQTAINADMDRFYSQYNLPRQDLANFVSMLTGSAPGGTTTSVQPNANYRNPLVTGAGAGLTLASLGRGFGLF